MDRICISWLEKAKLASFTLEKRTTLGDVRRNSAIAKE